MFLDGKIEQTLLRLCSTFLCKSVRRMQIPIEPTLNAGMRQLFQAFFVCSGKPDFGRFPHNHRRLLPGRVEADKLKHANQCKLFLTTNKPSSARPT
jgi:hypothetical protein